MKRAILFMVPASLIVCAGTAAAQSTRQGREAVRDYRARVQRGGRAPAGASAEDPGDGAKSGIFRERMEEAAQDRAMAEKLRKMPPEQREKLEREHRMNRVEQRVRSRRARSETAAAQEAAKPVRDGTGGGRTGAP